MNKTFNLLFYARKTKVNASGEVLIYLRITIDGRITEISTKRTIKSLKWSSVMQKVIGSSEENKSLNFYLKTFEQKVYNTYHSLMKDSENVTCEVLKNRLLGKDEFNRTLIPIFVDHNKNVETDRKRICTWNFGKI